MTVNARGGTPAQSTEATLRRLFLTLFLRGRSARGLKIARAPTTVGKKLAAILAMYALFGLMAFALSGQAVLVLATYLHALTFAFVGMFVATSAGEVLFNKEEADILLHRPISPRALLGAKVGVLLRVSLWLAGAFNLAGLYVGARSAQGGWLFVVAHLLSTTLEALFCTASVVMVYQLCLRWFGREKLDGFMTVTQIIVSISFVLGGQIVPRLMTTEQGRMLLNVNHWWIALIPPSWFAGIDDALAGSGAQKSWMLALIGVGATVAVLWIAFEKLAGEYQSGLQNITETSARRPAHRRRGVLSRLLSVPPLSWWFRDSVSRASFLLSAAYLARDRDTKLRIFPGIAPMLVLPVIMIFPRAGRSAAAMGSFGATFAGAYLGLIPLVALGMLEISQQWQAADVFRVAPLPGPAALSHGARRAVLLLLTAPMFVLVAALVLLFGGNASQLVMLLPGIIALPVYAMIPCRHGAVPFSRAPEDGKQAGRGLTMIGVMLSSGLLAGAATAAQRFGYFGAMLGAEVLVVAVIYWLMRVRVERASWPAID